MDADADAGLFQPFARRGSGLRFLERRLARGVGDVLAVDEEDCIRIGRRIMARLNWRKLGPGPTQSPTPPLRDPDQLLGIASVDPKVPFDPRDVIARIVDGSAFDEFKPLYGTSLVTGWASIHGYPVGILANARGILFSEEAEKAAQFIQLANQIDTPLVFLQNTTGYMVGAEYEQGGIIKHGAQMINAVSNSKVPHLTVIMGASYGAGNYGMNGRAYDPRFLFTWPSAKSAVMGPAQLAGVLSIVARAAAEAKGKEYDEEGDAGLRAFIEQSVEEQSLPFFLSGMLYDDGVIDPRDTRTVLAICLSVIENRPIEGTGRWRRVERHRRRAFAIAVGLVAGAAFVWQELHTRRPRTGHARLPLRVVQRRRDRRGDVQHRGRRFDGHHTAGDAHDEQRTGRPRTAPRRSRSLAARVTGTAISQPPTRHGANLLRRPHRPPIRTPTPSSPTASGIWLSAHFR